MLASSSSESLSQQQQNTQLIKSPQHEIKEQHNEQHLDLNSSEAIKLNRDRTEAIQAEVILYGKFDKKSFCIGSSHMKETTLSPTQIV